MRYLNVSTVFEVLSSDTAMYILVKNLVKWEFLGNFHIFGKIME